MPNIAVATNPKVIIVIDRHKRRSDWENGEVYKLILSMTFCCQPEGEICCWDD